MGKSNCAWRGDFACSVLREVYDEGEFLPLLPNEASQRTLRHLHACTRCIEFSPIRTIPQPKDDCAYPGHESKVL